MRKAMGTVLLLLFFVSTAGAGNITEFSRIVKGTEGKYTLSVPLLDVPATGLTGYRVDLTSADLINWTIMPGTVKKSEAATPEKAIVTKGEEGYRLDIPYLEYVMPGGSLGYSAAFTSARGADWVLNTGEAAKKKLRLPGKIGYTKAEIVVGELRWESDGSETASEKIDGLGTVSLAVLYVGEGEEEYALVSLDGDSMPDGRFVQVNAGGKVYTGLNLVVGVENGVDEEVAVITGELGDEIGAKFASKVKVGESMIMGVGSTRFRVQGNRAYLNGTLGKRTFNQVVDLMTSHPEVDTIVEENVPGSIDDETNMETGRLIRKFGLNTHVPADGEISSGGVDLFLAGVKRTLEKGARVGVHSWGTGDPNGLTARDYPRDAEEHKAQLSYVTEMLGESGPDFYFFTLDAAPFDGMHYMTDEEIARWKLTTP